VVILAMDEAGVSHENHHPWTGNWQTLSCTITGDTEDSNLHHIDLWRQQEQFII